MRFWGCYRGGGTRTSFYVPQIADVDDWLERVETRLLCLILN